MPRNKMQHASGLRESGARLAIAGLMQEWLDAEVPLLSKTDCLAQSLRGACAILAQKKCKILPGLVAAKTELHIAILLSGGSCKVCDS